MSRSLHDGGIERFVPVNDEHYAVIGNMFDFVQTLDNTQADTQPGQRQIKTA